MQAKYVKDSTKVQNKKQRKRWEPYADMGYQTSEYAHGLVHCYIATKADSENFIITIRDKDGNIAKMSDVDFVKAGGNLAVKKYKKDDGSIVEVRN